MKIDRLIGILSILLQKDKRTIEPYYIVFRWSSWYVYGWCLKRKDFRLFKLNRIDKLYETNTEFLCRKVPLPDLSDEKVFPDVIKVKALFSQDVKWRLVEESGPDCYSETKDGRLLFATDYTDMDNLIAWILTFGEKAEVPEPGEVRRRLLDIAGKMRQIYGGDRQDEI